MSGFFLRCEVNDLTFSMKFSILCSCNLRIMDKKYIFITTGTHGRKNIFRQSISFG